MSNTGALAAVTIIVTFTAGTALIMWMGEHITQKGIGNEMCIRDSGKLERNGRIYELTASSVEENSAWHAAVLLIVDITERERAEQQRQEFKMCIRDRRSRQREGYRLHFPRCAERHR